MGQIWPGTAPQTPLQTPPLLFGLTIRQHENLTICVKTFSQYKVDDFRSCERIALLTYMQQLSGFSSIKEICEWKCSDCGLDVELEGGAARVCSIYAQTSSLQSSLAEIVIMGDIKKRRKKHLIN